MTGSNACGRFLRINLSNQEIATEIVPDQVALDFVGGRGFGINYLYQELAPGVDPLGEHNKLLILTGVLAGTSAQSVSRWMVCTKSPLTGAFARSVCGGEFGAWLKFAGYEFIIIEGKAEKPVYIHLTRDSCQIHDADELWGKNTPETLEILSQRHGRNTKVACIGPASERLVKYGSIMTNGGAAGRCGTGTVMGSKNLKAIAITAQRSIQLHDPEAFKKIVKEQITVYRDSPVAKHHKDMGTTDTQDNTNLLSIFPVRNFRSGRLIDHEKISGGEYRKLRTGKTGCYGCFIQSRMKHTVTEGPYAGVHNDGPEYETIWAFSGSIDSANVEATIAAAQLCDEFGMDTISTGGCIGFAYELYERGILTKKDTGGLELTYGNHSAMIELIKQIASREGLGNILAEGTKRAAEIIGKGAQAYAMHVKGLELPAYDPRGAKAQGFNYATASIGASHCYGYSDQEIWKVANPREVDRFAEEENADIVIFNQDNTAIAEVGVVCAFTLNWGWFPQLFIKMLAAATGVDQFADPDYMLKVGKRIYALERAFNVREGFNRSHDTLPQRILNESLEFIGVEGVGQRVRYLDKVLDRYYQLRGWTPEGIPSPQTLNELGLSHVISDIT